MRPEAWEIGPGGAPGTLAATVAKSAYLGSTHVVQLDTELGPVFVVSADLSRMLAPGGGSAWLLGQHGVSVVAVTAR